jgi:sulfite reductase (NADPH) flavoprotein alpha-component
MSIDKSHPVHVTIKERKRLTKSGSSKETFHITLNLADADVHFEPGDSIGIYGKNDPLLVDHLLQAIGASGNEVIHHTRSGKQLSVREFFSTHANLSRVTSSFLKLLYDHEKSHDRKNQLGHLLDKENRPRMLEFLASHDPLDLFKEYKNTALPLQELCDQFGPLLPRFYSVASSKKTNPREVDLTVALFTFTHGDEQRFGVASHFLCHLADVEKTPVPIYVQPATAFHLPEDPETPIIMIGPGTGVAPFRAYMQERLSSGKNWLFFGERNRATDFFYEEFWTPLVNSGKLRLTLAFSRDQSEKIYVQHRMKEEASDLWKWIQEGAILYICGDAKEMAKDVTRTLEEIATAHGHDGKAFLKSLRAEKRLRLDVY